MLRKGARRVTGSIRPPARTLACTPVTPLLPLPAPPPTRAPPAAPNPPALPRTVAACAVFQWPVYRFTCSSAFSIAPPTWPIASSSSSVRPFIDATTPFTDAVASPCTQTWRAIILSTTPGSALSSTSASGASGRPNERPAQPRLGLSPASAPSSPEAAPAAASLSTRSSMPAAPFVTCDRVLEPRAKTARLNSLPSRAASRRPPLRTRSRMQSLKASSSTALRRKGRASSLQMASWIPCFKSPRDSFETRARRPRKKSSRAVRLGTTRATRRSGDPASCRPRRTTTVGRHCGSEPAARQPSQPRLPPAASCACVARRLPRPPHAEGIMPRGGGDRGGTAAAYLASAVSALGRSPVMRV